MRKALFSIAAQDIDDILRAAAGDLAALRGKKLFITGGTGFFGKWLLAALLHANTELDLGFELTVLSRDPNAFAARHPEVDRLSELTLLRGNVVDFTAEEWDFDFIIHAAADTTAVAGE